MGMPSRAQTFRKLTESGRRAGVAGTLEFGLLGPLEVRRNGVAVRIKAAKQRALLAALLVDANRVVPIDVLVARLWDHAPPRGARNTLQNYVLRLRALVGTGCAGVIETRPEGYLIETAADAVDLHLFQALVRTAEDVAADQPERASELTGRALDLWRGPPLLDVPSELLHRELVPALTERRLAAVELGIAADLRLGQPQRRISELRELTATYPLREELWAQLMLALYQAGRQAEALESYQTVAGLLVEELGVDPGPQLRAAQQAVLTGGQPDPVVGPAVGSGAGPVVGSLAGSAVGPVVGSMAGSAVGPVAGSVVGPVAGSVVGPVAGSVVGPAAGGRNELPGDLPDLVDRDEDLRALLAALPAGPAPAAMVAAIDGMAGVGKTALAVHAAHHLTHRHPDGQLFLDLRGHSAGRQPTAPAAALATLLRAVGVPDGQLPAGLDERAALWRAALAGRRVLLLLDDAADPAQVRPLLPGGPGCLVLITSRRRLTDLDTAYTCTLDVLSAPAAGELFTRVAGADRGTGPDPGSAADAERAAVDAAAVAEVVRLCGGLPLAIRLAAARLRGRPGWRAVHLASRLRDEQRRLAELATGDRSVAAEFALSYQHLSAAQQRLFRLLGLVPGSSFDPYLAASLAAVPVPVAEQLLEELVDVHLVEAPTPGRYRLQGLLYTHAGRHARLTETATELGAARVRLYDFYLHTLLAVARNRGLPAESVGEPAPGVQPVPFADERQAAGWLAAEAGNLRALLDSTDPDEPRGQRLAAVLSRLRGHHRQ